MNRGQLIELIIICSMIISFLCLSGCVDNNGSDDGKTENDWRYWPIKTSAKESESGYSSEQSDKVIGFNINENYVTKVIIELTWEDEPSSYLSGTNEPDSFNITIITPRHKTFHSDITANPVHGEGRILETIEILEYNIINNSAIGVWTVNIHCVNCGEDISNPPLVQITEDSGNSWELTYYYEYYSEE